MPVRLSSHQPLAPGAVYRLVLVAGVEFAVDALEMGVYGVVADRKLLRNCFMRAAKRKQGEDLLFAAGQQGAGVFDVVRRFCRDRARWCGYRQGQEAQQQGFARSQADFVLVLQAVGLREVAVQFVAVDVGAIDALTVADGVASFIALQASVLAGDGDAAAGYEDLAVFRVAADGVVGGL